MLHMIKLCVGVSSVDDLIAWRNARRADGFGRKDGLNVHRTRMMPKRAEEIVGKGALFWVISGGIKCRQRIVGLQSEIDNEGRSCCDILMDPEIIRTIPQPKRPFQGWRYLRAEDAPADLTPGTSTQNLELAEELAKLGLI